MRLGCDWGDALGVFSFSEREIAPEITSLWATTLGMIVAQCRVSIGISFVLQWRVQFAEGVVYAPGVPDSLSSEQVHSTLELHSRL